MAASAIASRDMTCFQQPGEVNMTQDGDMIRDVNIDAGHSVDAPYMCQEENSNTTLQDDDSNSSPKARDDCLSSSDYVGLDLSPAESKDALDKGNTNQGPDSEGTKYTPTYNQQLDSGNVKTTSLPDIDVIPSKSLFHTPDLFDNDHSSNPNVYWLSTEFARLISDKKKNVKTTEEMRKEIKAIGLGNVDLSSRKPKSVDDIMREYGLEPSVCSTQSNASVLSVKTAWMPKSMYSITNVSQNNDTLFGSKSEVDDVKTNGSSVDGEFGYMLRRHGSNSSFVNATSSTENASPYGEIKRLSKTPSFSYYDFKNSGSSTNLDSVTSSKANLDKRIDERSINPSLYFQRERERLQRIDSVISRTPKSSFTSIPMPNSWDLTDSTFSALRSQRSSYLNMDQAMRYGEEEKDWGNSSPSRAYLERSSSFKTSARQYSPLSYLSQYQNHDSPIFMDSSNFSSVFPGRHYSRTTANSGKHSTTHISKSAREPSASIKTATKQSSPSGTNKSLAENSRGYKVSKIKPRQSKSCNNKPKSMDDIDKDDFIVKLMKNYSNSHVMAENEMGLTNAKRDFISSRQDFQDPSRRFDHDSTNLYSEPIGRHQNDTKIKNGKYKPYQQNVVSMGNYSPDKFKDDASAPILSRLNMPTAWACSNDPGKQTLDDQNCSSVKPLPESRSQSKASTRNSADGKNSSIRFGSRQNPSALSTHGTGTANSHSSRGAKTSFHEGKMENSSSRMLNDIDYLLMDDSVSPSTNTFGEPDAKTNQTERKSKISKRNKSVPKKRSMKRK